MIGKWIITHCITGEGAPYLFSLILNNVHFFFSRRTRTGSKHKSLQSGFLPVFCSFLSLWIWADRHILYMCPPLGRTAWDLLLLSECFYHCLRITVIHSSLISGSEYDLFVYSCFFPSFVHAAHLKDQFRKTRFGFISLSIRGCVVSSERACEWKIQLFCQSIPKMISNCRYQACSQSVFLHQRWDVLETITDANNTFSMDKPSFSIHSLHRFLVSKAVYSSVFTLRKEAHRVYS